MWICSLMWEEKAQKTLSCFLRLSRNNIITCRLHSIDLIKSILNYEIKIHLLYISQGHQALPWLYILFSSPDSLRWLHNISSTTCPQVRAKTSCRRFWTRACLSVLTRSHQSHRRSTHMTAVPYSDNDRRRVGSVFLMSNNIL